MGNFITSESLESETESESNKSNNINELNFIVSYYLYNMSWESLNDLLHKKYCEKLIKLITTIITKYYHVEHDSALSLAKLFVKIGHIYACIMVNVNPMIKINNANTNTNTDKEEDKTTTILLSKYNHKNMHRKKMKCKGNCKMPIIEDIHQQLQELDGIYFDKEYNMKTHMFEGASEEVKKIHKEDIQYFADAFLTNNNNNTKDTHYRSFTDAFKQLLKDVPDDIVIDIDMDADTRNNNTMNLFALYASTIKIFIFKYIQFQEELIEKLSYLFVLEKNSNSKAKAKTKAGQKEEIAINSRLTEDDLNAILKDVRGTILEMNLLCDEFYHNVHKIFEAIIELRIFIISKLQVKSLENTLEELALTEISAK